MTRIPPLRRTRTRMRRQAPARTRRTVARSMSWTAAAAARTMSRAAMATVKTMRPEAAGDGEDEEAGGDGLQQGGQGGGR